MIRIEEEDRGLRRLVHFGDGVFCIGRNELSDIIDPGASRRHFEIEQRDGEWYVTSVSAKRSTRIVGAKRPAWGYVGPRVTRLYEGESYRLEAEITWVMIGEHTRIGLRLVDYLVDQGLDAKEAGEF